MVNNKGKVCPERIVSVSPSNTEMLFAVGAGFSLLYGELTQEVAVNNKLINIGLLPEDHLNTDGQLKIPHDTKSFNCEGPCYNRLTPKE
ncbi:MAG: hypothetical protein P8X84_04965 [Candidatus Bathyarchaeota archaeon]